MKKVSVVLGTALVCLAASSAWAGGWEDPNDMYSYSNSGMSANQIGMNSSPGMSSGFTMPVNPNMLASTYAGGGMGMGMMPSSSSSMGMMPSMGMGMMGGGMGSGYPSGGSTDMPVVDLRRVVMQGVQTLPQQQQVNGAYNMATQNLQTMSGNMSPIYQMRNNIRNQIMGNRINEISRMGQNTFRPMIQPGAVQSMISQIQPWNFPIRFQSAMMPQMVPIVSQPIKQRQMAYMQQGIMNNPNFPNVPLPSPYYGSYGSSSGMGMGGYGGGYDMSSSGMGMMPGMGMGMPNMGGMMGGGMGMMPSMGMGGMMGGGMMPNMGMF